MTNWWENFFNRIQPEKEKPMLYDITQAGDYTIVAALRGPDYSGVPSCAANTLKILTTGIIRYFAGVPWFCVGVVNSPTEVQRLWIWVDPQEHNLQAKNKDLTALGLWQREFHFRQHAQKAWAALRERFPEKVAEMDAYNKWLAETTGINLDYDTLIPRVTAPPFAPADPPAPQDDGCDSALTDQPDVHSL